jgi:hypothetical protein
MNSMVLKITAVSIAAVALLGCEGVHVSKFDPNDPKGIPFNVKVPQEVHTTQIEIQALAISVSATGKGADGKDVTTSYPSVPITVPLTPGLLAMVLDLRQYVASLPPVSDPTQSQQELSAIVNKLNALAIASDSAMKAIYASPGIAPGTRLTANTLAVESVLSTERYAFTPVVPLVGTNDTSFELSGDGTLTKGEVKVEDDTAKTILGVLPIQPFLSKILKLNTAGGNQDHAFGGAAEIKIALAETDASMTYTMKKNWANGDSLAPLSIKQALDGSDGVNLASVTQKGDDSGSKKDDKPAFEFSGRVVPPPADKGNQ